MSNLFDDNFNNALNYNDVFIIPRHSNISTRKKVDISSQMGKFKVPVPVISANMESVTGARMCKALKKAGALGALHRFQSIDRAVEDLTINLENDKLPTLVSVGVNRDAHERAEILYNNGARFFIVDIAHGHSEHMKAMIEFLKDLDQENYVIAGNVATGEAAFDLAMWGADAIKVGVGPGSVCVTKNVTGVTVPGFSSVMAAVHGARKAEVEILKQEFLKLNLDYENINLETMKRIPVIADGGFKEYGDICKALGAGADFIMSGRFFAACDEAPNGRLYRGSASQDVQKQYRNDKQMPTPEGKSEILEEAGPVKDVVEAIAGGLRSAFSYVGAHNIEEFHEKCSFGIRKHPQERQ